jgi:hypothetical protein
VGQRESLAEQIAMGGGYLVIGGLLVLGYQAVKWLKDGWWQPLQLSEVWGGGPPFYSSWAGVQKIGQAIAELPVSGVCIVVGVLVVMGGAAIGPRS